MTDKWVLSEVVLSQCYTKLGGTFKQKMMSENQSEYPPRRLSSVDTFFYGSPLFRSQAKIVSK